MPNVSFHNVTYRGMSFYYTKYQKIFENKLYIDGHEDIAQNETRFSSFFINHNKTAKNNLAWFCKPTDSFFVDIRQYFLSY